MEGDMTPFTTPTCQNFLSHPSDVGEGLLGGGDQPGPPLPDLPLILLHVVIALVVTSLGDIAYNR